jgi:putative ABC transport system permease protein
VSLIDGLRHRLYVLRRGEHYGDEVAREMAFHADLDTLARTRDRSGQLAAELSARRALGNVTYYREEVRRMTPLAWLDGVRQDLGYAWRGLTRSPGFTIAVVLTLGLGIGVNASVFSFLNRLFLRVPDGVVDAESVRRLYMEFARPDEPSGRLAFDSFSYPYIRALTLAEDSSVKLAGFTSPDSTAIVSGDARVPIRLSRVTRGYFSLLGVAAERGRLFTGEENQIESPTPVAVLSDALWRSAFGADEHIVGRTIAIGSRPFTVVGVTAPSFSGIDIDAVDVWLPANTYDGSRFNGLAWYDTFRSSFRIVARVPPSVPETRVLSAATSAIRSVHLAGWVYDSTAVVRDGSILRAAGPSKRDQEVSISTRIAGVALIVLLIAIANVTNLLLVRAGRRRREIAVRRALGVSGTRLYQQLLTESVLLGLLGGACAALFAIWGAATLRGLLLPRTHWATRAIDGSTLAFIALASVAAGVVAGLAPGFQSTRPGLIDSLRAGAREGSYRHSRLRSALLVVQTALSVVLMIGAGLFVRSLDLVRSIDTGFDVEHLIFVGPRFPGAKPPATEVAASLDRVLEALRRAPTVEGVGLASITPMRGFSFVTITLPDRDSLPLYEGERMPAMVAVSSGYFGAAGIPILAGRDFGNDDRQGGPGALIVSRAMARVYWPGKNAVGQCVILGKRGSPCATVVGIVGDVHRDNIIEKQRLQYYLPATQVDTLFRPTTLVLRANDANLIAAGSLAATELQRAFPSSSPPVIRTMTQTLEPQFRPWRLGAELFVALGLLALVVAAIGVYSVVAYSVSQRTREMGIRIALGARAADVLSLVVGEGARTVAIGVLIGVIAALLAGRLVATLLYGITPHDPAVLVTAAVALMSVGAAASLLPSWRAATVDPVVALRAD